MNARRNEDKMQPSTINYNSIENVEDITGSGTITEPVILVIAKDYLRLGGFQPNAAVPEDDYDFDDDLITSMIIEGRKWVEIFTGVHLVPKTLEVSIINGSGFMRIPGPVTGDITYTDKNGNVLTDVEKIGVLFPKVNLNTDILTVLQYEAGYGSDCPDWARNAIKAYVAWSYENRGDEKTDSPEKAANICRPYIRTKSFG